MIKSLLLVLIVNIQKFVRFQKNKNNIKNNIIQNQNMKMIVMNRYKIHKIHKLLLLMKLHKKYITQTFLKSVINFLFIKLKIHLQNTPKELRMHLNGKKLLILKRKPYMINFNRLFKNMIYHLVLKKKIGIVIF